MLSLLSQISFIALHSMHGDFAAETKCLAHARPYLWFSQAKFILLTRCLYSPAVEFAQPHDIGGSPRLSLVRAGASFFSNLCNGASPPSFSDYVAAGWSKQRASDMNFAC